MKSLERRFSNTVKRNPYWSSYTCFAEALAGQKFSKQTLHRWFQKLVDKDDYARQEKREILKHLIALTNTVRATKTRHKHRA